jgi:hypothetical protein
MYPIENNFETIILNAFQRLNQHINILFCVEMTKRMRKLGFF